MKIYLDDERKAPEGWIQRRWPEEVIEDLKTGKVIHLSLDHDLGEGSEYEHPRTGYDVILWLEEQVKMNGLVPPRYIYIHSANPVARQKMKAGLKQIYASRRIPWTDHSHPYL